ncbi:hypothetical protein [Azospirillum canadense]|uniref:hypothetical protein n=1 Tax=Azospirillum canadense TaxID=403962 RepID=UPI0022270978|nr:hypothetical protein [Azospirillum canadense]MCW2240751.1 hypothetical protein [Azospirillum canadense]
MTATTGMNTADAKAAAGTAASGEGGGKAATGKDGAGKEVVTLRHGIVANRVGGVGKTTTTMLLADALRGAEVFAKAKPAVRGKPAVQQFEEQLRAVAVPSVSLLDVDVQPGGDRNGSNLARRFDKVMPFELAPTASDLAQDPTLAYSHFDNLGATLLQRRCLVDFGANVIDPFLEWAAMGEVGIDWARRGIGIDFLVPTTADDRALTATADAIEAMRKLCAPHGVDLRCFVVLNWRDGPFTKYEHSEHWRKVLALGETTASKTIHVKKCTSELWQLMDQARLTPVKLLAMTEDEIAETWPTLSTVAMRRGYNQMLAWYREVVDEMIDSGLLRGGVPRIPERDAAG